VASLSNWNLKDLAFNQMEFDWGAYTVLIQVSLGYSVEKGTFPRVTHPSAADPERSARLACVRPAASVRSEPGSNSQVERQLLVYP
jgi:hypothetical protein